MPSEIAHAKGIMSKKKDPPGYPGDEVVKKRLGEILRELRLSKGMSLKEVDAFFTESTRQHSHALLPRALGIVTRRLREDRKMSRVQLSDASGVPLKLINRIERGKARETTVTQLFRLAFGMNLSIRDFLEQVENLEQRLQSDAAQKR